MPSSHLSSSQLPHLHYFSLTHLLASFSPVSSSSPPSHFSFLFFSPFLSYHGWAETPPSRCCWFSQGHCWPWGTQKHSDQCSDMITPEVCLSSDGPRWCRQALWTPQNKALWSALLSDPQLSQNNAPGATCVAVCGDTLKTVFLHKSRNVAFFCQTYETALMRGLPLYNSITINGHVCTSLVPTLSMEGCEHSWYDSAVSTADY